MRNPWVHDERDVSTTAGDIHESRAKVLAVLVWGVLVAVVAALVVFSGGNLRPPGPQESISLLSVAFGVVLFLLFGLPVLLKLLAVSRLLAAFVLFGSLGLVGRYFASNGAFLSEEYRVLTAELGANLGELVEILESLSTLL